MSPFDTWGHFITQHRKSSVSPLVRQGEVLEGDKGIYRRRRGDEDDLQSKRRLDQFEFRWDKCAGLSWDVIDSK